MSEHIVWSCGAARRDKITSIVRLDDGRYELQLEDVFACVVLAAEDGVEVFRQLREPTADLERVTDAAVRFGQALAEHPKSAAQVFAEEPSGKNSTADAVDVSVSPVVGVSWPGSAATPEAFSVLVDTDTVRWAAVLPHAAARGLIRELQSYVDTHDTHG